jgi:error-prone DNA polymerase
MDRRAALWAARRLDVIGISTARRAANSKIEDPLPLLTPHLSDELFAEEPVALPAVPLAEHVVEDYVATGLSLKAHPVRFFRDRLTMLGAVHNMELSSDALPQDSMVTAAGLVLIRQRPGTAKGVVFLTIEDETGPANIIVWPKVFEENRRIVMTARFLAIRGRLQRVGLVIHIVAESFVDLSAHLPWLREGGDLFSPQFSGGQPPNSYTIPHKSRDFH